MTTCTHRDHKGRRCILGPAFHLVHSYTRPAQVGRKRRREMPALDAARETLRARNGGACECWHAPACGVDEAHYGTDPHHMDPADRDRGVHEPERMLWLCRRAHDWAHANPPEAATIGLLRPEAEAS